MKYCEEIKTRVTAYLSEILNDLGKVIAVPAVAPDFGGNGELERCKQISIIAKEPKLFDSIERFDSDRTNRATDFIRPNLVARVNGNDSSAPTTWVVVHMDEVPPGDSQKWLDDPRKLILAREVNGGLEKLDIDKVVEYMGQSNPDQLVVVGRSVDDNSKPGICALYALRVLRDMELQPKGNVGIAWVADEENGKSTHGIRYLAEDVKLFHPDDKIIVPDFGNKDGSCIEIAEKSRIVLKITTTGMQGHSADPYDNSKNALEHGAAYIGKLLAHQRGKYDLEYRLFNPPYSTIQWTMSSEGGATPNTVSGEHIAKLDMRLLPNYDVDEIISEAHEMAREYGTEHKVNIVVETELYRPAPPATSPESPVVQGLIESVKSVRGITPEVIGIGAGTCANHIRKVKIDDRYLQAAVYASLTETEHKVNERARLDHIIADTRVFAHMFLS